MVIEDTGGGEGASAFVDYDDVTRKPSRIVITSPGINYTEAMATFKSRPNELVSA